MNGIVKPGEAVLALGAMLTVLAELFRTIGQCLLLCFTSVGTAPKHSCKKCHFIDEEDL